MGLACFDDPEADVFFECEEEDQDLRGFDSIMPPEEPEPESATASGDPGDNSFGAVDVEYLEALLPEADDTVEPTATESSSSVAGCAGHEGMPAMKLRRIGLASTEAESTTASEIPLSSFQVWLTQLQVEHTEEVVTKHFWNTLSGTQVYNYLYDKLRGFYCMKVHPVRPETKEEFQKLSGLNRQKTSRKAFQQLSHDDKKIVAMKWVECCKPAKYVAQATEMHFKLDQIGKGKKECCKGVMFTWILPETVVGELSLPPPQTWSTLDGLVVFLRTHEKLRELWDQIREHGQDVRRLAGASDVAISLEVCPETFELQKTIRLHVHCFVVATVGNMVFRVTRVYHLFNRAPNLSFGEGTGSKAKGRNQWSGFLYCCLPMKKGTVCCDSTKAPFTGFQVNPNWIMVHLQSGKLDRADARKLLVRCENASRLVAELDKNEAEQEREAVLTAQRGAEELLAQVERPVKSYPKVTAFVNQFKHAKHRYMFLVLAGPSRVGKTAFARTLCDPGKETLEINCAGGAEPDLRAYRLSRHGLILFDEIRAEQVSHQRKLFQAGSAPVQLGNSATNCHSYPVFVWRKKLVLASNCWHESVASLPPDAQDWIKCNAIVLDVKEKMYYE